MTLTHYGIREWGGGGLIALILLAGCWFLAKYVNLYLGVIPGIFILLVYGFIAFFFRNPRRKLPEDVTLLISPADGTVRDITVVEDFDQAPFEGKALRIGIFLSVLRYVMKFSWLRTQFPHLDILPLLTVRTSPPGSGIVMRSPQRMLNRK